MGNLSNIGRIFFGIAIAGTGFPTIYYKVFPYMLLPPQNFLLSGPIMLTYIFGTLFILVGVCIVFEKKTRPVSFLFGCVLLLIFCFFFVPYQFMVNPNYMHLAEWENAEKELALAGGAFVIASCFSEKSENSIDRFWGKLMPFGAILFSIPIISFGILHLLFTKEASTLVPLWVPYPIFWTFLAGIALIGSGVAIILKIKPGLIAALLGAMIFIWFIILHIPRVIVSPSADRGDEIVSAFLALAYSGIAFVIAGAAKKKV
jgi:uncharacterized membrane protein YphA (DoxX/SURF4 family)